MKPEEILDLIKELGASNVALIPVADIPFDRSFRTLCEANSCGNYGKNWMCPPDAGDIDELIARVRGYQQAIIYQQIGQLEDSYDFEGMMEAGQRMHQLTMTVRERLKGCLTGALYLGAGGCRVCPVCARRTDEPCRFPDLAMMSLETCGIAVSDLAKRCGMKYINGQNTVTYFAAILLKS